MRAHHGNWWWLAAVVALLALPRGAEAQSVVASRGPRFLMAGSKAGGGADASNAPVLRRRVSLSLDRVTVDDALNELARRAGLELSYSPRVVALARPVTLKARDITIAAALTEILLDVPVDVSITSGGHLALVQRMPVLSPVQSDSGAIAGRVTDAHGEPIAGATVTAEGARALATTGPDGRYRIGGLSVGTYTVRARYIGYAPSSRTVVVSADAEIAADFVLTKSAQELDQVVVTGTIVPTAVKAVPTPVSVITAEDVALRRPQTVAELFRQAVPGAVGWDYPSAPMNTTFSVRGANTLTGSSQMKVFIDGVEAASPGRTPVDPNSIDRIEVVRGPQAAAIYGSDAIGGVVQIFTKRGDPALSRPRATVEVGVGIVQTPYATFDGVVRQDYKASVQGGTPDASYNFGGGYSHIGNYLPNNEISRQSNPSAYGGMRLARGIITVDLSGRYLSYDSPNVFNPELMQTGFAFYSKPNYQPAQVKNATLGARLSVAATAWWQHTLTLGLDRLDEGFAQTQPRLTRPADTLFTIFDHVRSKTSIAYNTSVKGSLRAGLTASLTAGFDHYSLPETVFFTNAAVNNAGPLQLVPGGFSSETMTHTTNTGYFAQAQLGFKDALFLTGGVRIERNSGFGDSLGSPVSPRIGASYALSSGFTTIKFRGSWGRAIRPPAPGQRVGGVGTLANPLLGPERQRGWDAGIDAAFGTRGSLSITGFDQIADNLIQFVEVQSVPTRQTQYQNVGRVKNVGLEVEGSLFTGPIQLKAQYAYTRSRVEELGPNYTGDLRAGDQSLLTPKHTLGMSAVITLLKRTTLVAGVTYVGSWTYYDFLAEYRCFGGTGPCRPTLRDYLMEYPGFAKVNASASQQITPAVSAFLSMENVGNNNAFEFFNLSPVIGRTTTIGFRVQY